ncbi:MAG: methyltransferase domain-containing protein [bacterium]|nr:methyltransferase domain-containing protein [bacterium]
MVEDFQYEGRDLEAMSLAPNYHAWILREFAPYLGKKVAEVGAGSGTFSALLLQYPTEELVAVEPSREMYPLLLERFRGDARVTCRHESFTTISAQHHGHFDSVLYVNVLEHIADDEKELRHVYESLKDGGIVCIFVPALQWLFGEHDRSVGHKRRYYKEPMKNLLEKTGFEVLKLHYFDIAGVIPWFLFMRVLKQRLGGNTAAWYDSTVVPVMGRIESLMSPPIGKNLVAVARKRL